MKLPRDVSGEHLIALLARFGYKPTRQTGSHVRLTVFISDAHRSVTIPMHSPLRIGTLSAILSEVAGHLQKDREQLTSELFER